MDASVLPPAVGASTTAFLPSRIASPASSCTSLSDVKPSWFAMACCRRSGNREKMLMPRSHGDGRAIEAIVRRRLVELPPGEDGFLLRAEGARLGRKAEQLVGVLVRVIRQNIEDVHER